MSILAKRSEGKKEAPGGILLLAKEAQQAKVKDNEVIDATIGMLYKENNEFFSFNVVDKASKLLEDKKKYAYTTTQGNEDYLDGVLSWVLRDKKDEILSKMHVRMLATPGGSGAISNAFCNHLNIGDTILLPSYMWSAYTQFANECQCNYEEYLLFDENFKFNINDLKNKAIALKEKQQRIFLVINDPCHNPTGYSMSNDEWNMVVDLLNELSGDNTPCILLYDMAYIDYDLRGLDYSRNNIALFTKLNDNVLVTLCFSGSKTIGLYGLRIGAQIILGKNKNNVIDSYEASCYSSRAKWSMSSTLGMNIISSIFNNQNLFKEFEGELNTIRDTMKKRSEAFFDACQKCKITTLPYSSGFFVSIKTNNDKEVCNKLINHKAYVVPLGGYIRIALCAISIEESKRLPYLLKEAL